MPITSLFTQETIDCIAIAIPQMALRDQRQIKVSLCSPDVCPSEDFLARMLHFCPENSPNANIGDTYNERLRFMMGPLLVWGLSQPWAAKCDIKSALFVWSHILKSFPATTTMTPASIGLSLLPLLDNTTLQIKQQQKQDLYAHLYRTMSPLVPWGRAEPDNPSMMALAELSCRNVSATIGAELLAEHWKRHMDNLMHAASYYDQKCLLNTVVQSSLPKSYQLSMFNAANPLHWLDSQFIPSIKELLSPRENIRSLELPWVSDSSIRDTINVFRNHDVNRRIYEEYCPDLYIGLSLVATSDTDWQKKQSIWSYVDGLSVNHCTDEMTLDTDELVPNNFH